MITDIGKTFGGAIQTKSAAVQSDDQQLRTFTRWWNSHLIAKSLEVTDLFEDVKQGVLPIRLLEVLSASTCGKVRLPCACVPQRLRRSHVHAFLRTNRRHAIPGR